VQNRDWFDILVKATSEHHKALQLDKDEQLRAVIGMSDERDPRYAEIIDQHEGEGAINYWLGMLMIDASSAPATYQLIRVARRIGEMVVMCLKNEYREARPSQACPAIVPMIDPPVTPAFPAGHALQSHLISLCLAAAGRAPVQGEMLFHLSRRLAENRIIAGLHYPLDNQAGVLAANRCFATMLMANNEQNKPVCPEFRRLVLEAQAESVGGPLNGVRAPEFRYDGAGAERRTRREKQVQEAVEEQRKADGDPKAKGDEKRKKRREDLKRLESDADKQARAICERVAKAKGAVGQPVGR
jgi:hypothetical protein